MLLLLLLLFVAVMLLLDMTKLLIAERESRVAVAASFACVGTHAMLPSVETTSCVSTGSNL